MPRINLYPKDEDIGDFAKAPKWLQVLVDGWVLAVGNKPFVKAWVGMFTIPYFIALATSLGVERGIDMYNHYFEARKIGHSPFVAMTLAQLQALEDQPVYKKRLEASLRKLKKLFES